MTTACLHINYRTEETVFAFPVTITRICLDCGETRTYSQRKEQNEDDRYSAYVIGNAAGKAVYIGQTVDFNRRLGEHQKSAEKEHSHTDCCNGAFFQRYGLTDVLHVYDGLTRAQAQTKERALAEQYKIDGWIVKGGK